MNTYIITFRQKSSCTTPFWSDTIFGHFCWAIRFIWGNDLLKKHLRDDSYAPFLVLSDAFPDKFMPRPLLPEPPIKKIEELLHDYISNPVDLSKKAMLLSKRVRKEQFLSRFIFDQKERKISNLQLINDVVRGNLCIRSFQKPPERCKPGPGYYNCPLINAESDKKSLHRCSEIESVKSYEQAHNTMNRINNRVIENGFFFIRQTWTDSNSDYYFFLKTGQLEKEDLEKCLLYLNISGFGKKKSSGQGQLTDFSVKPYEEPNNKNFNAFVNMSHCVMEKNNPVDGHYKIDVKYGKLGGSYARESYPPFKKPLIMITPGSVFKDSPVKPFYGRMVTKIHRDETIVQNGYCFPIGMHYEPEKN